MDVETILRRIKRQFGDEYDVLINDDDIYGWIYEAEMEIIRNTGSNEQQQTALTSAFPLNIPDNVNIIRLSIDGKALTYLPVNELTTQNLNLAATGARSSWYKKNSSIYLYPSDSLVQTVKIDYTKIPTVMQGDATANTFTIPERYRTDVIQWCLSKAHDKNRNYQAARMHMENFERATGIRVEEAASIDGPIYKGADPMDLESELDLWYG